MVTYSHHGVSYAPHAPSRLHRPALRRTERPDEKTRLGRQAEALDATIDRLVYELYGLTEVEIRVVEG